MVVKGTGTLFLICDLLLTFLLKRKQNDLGSTPVFFFCSDNTAQSCLLSNVFCSIIIFNEAALAISNVSLF